MGLVPKMEATTLASTRASPLAPAPLKTPERPASRQPTTRGAMAVLMTKAGASFEKTERS